MVSRKLFPTRVFIDKLVSYCKTYQIEVDITYRFILYLVEIGLLLPVRTKASKYERKNYSLVDLKVAKLLLEVLRGQDTSRRNIKAAIESIALSIKRNNLIEKEREKITPSSIEENNEQLVFIDAYKRYLDRTSQFGYTAPDKTNILGIRKGDHVSIFMHGYARSTKKILFHELVKRTIQSIHNEICVVISRESSGKIQSGLYRKLSLDKRENIRFLFLINLEDIERQITNSYKTKDRNKGNFLKFFAKIMSRNIYYEALNKQVDLHNIEHIWIINEVASNLYKSWPTKAGFIEVERNFIELFNKVTGKDSTFICIYEKDELFNAIQQRGKDILTEVAYILGSHNRIYAHDEMLSNEFKLLRHYSSNNLVAGPYAMQVILLWIKNELTASNKKTTF